MFPPAMVGYMVREQRGIVAVEFEDLYPVMAGATCPMLAPADAAVLRGF